MRKRSFMMRPPSCQHANGVRVRVGEGKGEGEGKEVRVGDGVYEEVIAGAVWVTVSVAETALADAGLP